MSNDTDRIRALNDDFRKSLPHTAAIITTGIAALGAEAVRRLVTTVAVFDDFCHANDPHEEHDFGTFDCEGTSIIFKIDYYDHSLNFHSPNPADPSVTRRIITIMRADEY